MAHSPQAGRVHAPAVFAIIVTMGIAAAGVAGIHRFADRLASSTTYSAPVGSPGRLSTAPLANTPWGAGRAPAPCRQSRSGRDASRQSHCDTPVYAGARAPGPAGPTRAGLDAGHLAVILERPLRPSASLAVSTSTSSSGTRVVLRLATVRAQACWFAVAGDLADHTTPRPCSRGFTSGTLALPPNLGRALRSVRLIAYAKNVGGIVRSIVAVVEPRLGTSGSAEPPAAHPSVGLVAPVTTLGPDGGRVTLDLVETGATTCWLDVPGDPSAAVHRSCQSGFASLPAAIGMNSSGRARQITILAFASNGNETIRRALVLTETGSAPDRVGTTGIGPVVVPTTEPVPSTSTVPAEPTAPVSPALPSAPSGPAPSPPPTTTTSSTVAPNPLAIDTSSLPGATASSAYSTTLVSSGGTSPYVWSLVSGSSLPSGLTLSSSGVLSGTPGTAGTWSVTMTVTDATGAHVSATFSLAVAPTSALAVLTTELPSESIYGGYSADLVASGGTSPYVWSLASGSSLPSGLTLSSSGVLSGYGVASGLYTFSVEVSDSSSPVATAVQPLELYVVGQYSSANWSGYEANGGPFTAVSGTFVVPSVGSSSGTTYTAIWAGIDGSGNSYLIQAGIQVEYQPGSGMSVIPWWEILPASETPITSMSVAVGDTVTVSIAEISSGSWSIGVADDTNGESFTTTQSYSGPGATAEWVVEQPQVNGSYSTLGDYSPDVAFTNLGYTGTPTSFDDLYMSDSGTVVSTPSPIDGKGFNVAYGATAPGYPA